LHDVRHVREVARLLGYEVEIGLREGLRRTWDWFRAHSDRTDGTPRLGVATQVA